MEEIRKNCPSVYRGTSAESRANGTEGVPSGVEERSAEYFTSEGCFPTRYAYNSLRSTLFRSSLYKQRDS